jgi:DnaD/phage-associated family protein
MENWTEQGGFMEVPTKVPTQVPTSVGTEVPDQVVFKVKVKDKIKVKLIEEEEDARAKKIADVLNSYFDEIGNITPVIKSEITEMLDSGVPPEWFALAFRECAANDVRTWAYAKAILNRWIADGKVTDNRKNGSRSDRKRASPQSGGDIDAFRALARAQQQANETKREESERKD